MASCSEGSYLNKSTKLKEGRLKGNEREASFISDFTKSQFKLNCFPTPRSPLSWGLTVLALAGLNFQRASHSSLLSAGITRHEKQCTI